MVTDSKEATRQTAEMMAAGFGLNADAMLQSPMSLIGTPDECVVELKRRAKEWGVTQFVFSSMMGITKNWCAG